MGQTVLETEGDMPIIQAGIDIRQEFGKNRVVNIVSIKTYDTKDGRMAIVSANDKSFRNAEKVYTPTNN
ncbi:MAG: hypothetical protein QXU40_01375 [Candidatus Pacearchaeota archaeon]